MLQPLILTSADSPVTLLQVAKLGGFKLLYKPMQDLKLEVAAKWEDNLLYNPLQQP